MSKKSEQDKLDEAVAYILKYKSKLTLVQINALYFGMHVEVMERENKGNNL